MKVTILNWAKINGRKDLTTPWWFKFKNKFFTDSDFYDFTAEEIVFWLYLLCEASTQNKNGEVTLWGGCSKKEDLSFSNWHDRSMIRHRVFQNSVKSCLEKLQERSIVTLDPARIRTRSGQIVASREEKRREEKRREEVEADLDASASPQFDPQFLVEIWNKNRGILPECKALSAERKKHAIARLREEPAVDYWLGVITRMAKSKFCQGENYRGWRASFDFLLRPDTHIKVSEGKYDGRDVSNPNGLSPEFLAEIENERKRMDEEHEIKMRGRR